MKVKYDVQTQKLFKLNCTQIHMENDMIYITRKEEQLHKNYDEDIKHKKTGRDVYV